MTMPESNLELIDSHAHLDLLDDAEAAMARARAAGVGQVVTIGIDLASSRVAAELARRWDDVSFTVGVHPHDAAKVGEDDWRELARLAREEGAVAWGEIGLDYFRDRSPREVQRQAFARQIELALELGLPLIIHDREAHDDTLAMLAEQDAGRVGGVVHCFSGDATMAKKVVDLGFALGVDGPVTYPKNDALREAMRAVPLESLMLETDCPYLSPQAKRGKPNEPAYVAYTCQGLAQTLGLEAARVARVTSANTRRVLGLPEVG